MKILLRPLVLLFGIILISCSSDNNSNSDEPIVETETNIKPTAVVLSLVEQDCTSMLISWTASTDENENDIVKYKVYINDNVVEDALNDLQLTIDATSFTYPFLIKIIAYDNHQGESNPSNILGIGAPISSNIIFTEANMKQALLDNETPIDLNTDGEISECEAFLFTGTLNLLAKNISSLDDLIYFTQATVLDARDNSIDDASVLTDLSFEEIYLGFNSFVGFNMGNNPKLKTLWLGHNLITSINLAPYENLEDVNLTDNLLTNVDISNNSLLTYLYLDRNSISQIDVSSNLLLKTLGISENDLTHIDITNNTDLEWVAVSNNLLSSFYIEQNINLEFVACGDNFIEQLDFSNQPNLETVYCRRNDQLTQLNLKNGNNNAIVTMYGSQNLNLSCVQVDDVNNIPSSWVIDVTADYSEDCNY